MIKDSYLTIAEPTIGEFKDRGSKFWAYSQAVFSQEDIKDFVDLIKKEHPKARHHCYAYRLGLDKNNFRANDDGEPSGTAGRPILGQIDSFGLTNVMIIVVRYFGGTKLGVPGLINAYKTSTIDALEQAKVIEKIVENKYEITFDYGFMSDVMGFLKKNDLTIQERTFEEKATLTIAIRKSEADQKLQALEDTVNPYGQLEESPITVKLI